MNKRVLLLAAVVAAVWSTAALAQNYEGLPIREVRVSGLERVNEQAVRGQLEAQAGEPYSSPMVARDIRRLFDTGYFSNIAADVQVVGGEAVLTYLVEEKRFIEEIKVIGANRVRERQVRGAISWREGDTFVREAYAEERQKVLELYQSKGFPNATVDIVVEEVGASRVRITYVINEGNKARIKKIDFENNDVLSDRKLRRVMDTKRSWWFFGGTFDENVFENDLERITEEYADYGRLEAEIDRADFEYNENGKKLYITIALTEGPEYTVETLAATGNAVFDDDEIMRLLDVQAGDVHNASEVREDAGLIQKGYHDSGYINAGVDPQVTLDRDKKTTHIVHRISEDDLKYIREIKITGNSVTRDEVIRREMLSYPGERFDGSLLQASQRRLQDTEFFEKVFITRDYINYEDMYYDVLVDVDEGDTGYFNFGAGYSTEENVTGYAELRLNNFDLWNPPRFRGAGQQFRLRVQLGDQRSQYFLGFTDPEFLGYPIAVGFDVFDESYKYTGGTDYTEDRQGAQLRFGKILSPFNSARMMIRYTDTEISDLPAYVVLAFPREFIDQRKGSTTISTIWGFTRNTQDSRLDPTRGSRHDVQLEFAGLGGDNHFVKLEHESIWYWSLDDDRKWVLSYKTREGWATEYGSSEYVPLQDRFFAGGTSTIRGYDSRDVGPKEGGLLGIGEPIAVGGTFMLVNNLELKYKLTDAIRMYYFVDAGGVWSDASDFDAGDIKYGAGLGFGVDVPRMGPIRVDYGFALNPDEDQDSGRWHLQTGLRF